jgi:small subunit ribosomal protein S8
MVTDSIGDMFTRIRNALLMSHPTVSMPYSKLKANIAAILQQEGYIEGYEVTGEVKMDLVVTLKYFGRRRVRRPVITDIQRVSTPGRRVYATRDDIPRVRSGMGVAILSTPKGVMTGAQARREGVGGEVLGIVY